MAAGRSSGASAKADDITGLYIITSLNLKPMEVCVKRLQSIVMPHHHYSAVSAIHFSHPNLAGKRRVNRVPYLKIYINSIVSPSVAPAEMRCHRSEMRMAEITKLNGIAQLQVNHRIQISLRKFIRIWSFRIPYVVKTLCRMW